MIHGAMYRQLLGADGTDLRPHPISLVEEPEAHLHPAAQADLANQLVSLPGQVIATTHSSHTVTYAPPTAVRLLRRMEGKLDASDLHFEPESNHIPNAQRWLRDELEKVKRLVERPFGELLFADAVVIPDGATERALLPPILKHVLGPRAAGIVVVDPQSMSNATPLVKFLRRTRTPCFLFADGDEKGLKDLESLKSAATGTYQLEHAVYPNGLATESFFLTHFPEVALNACEELRMQNKGDRKKRELKLLQDAKGTGGRILAYHFINLMESPAETNKGDTKTTEWPSPFKELIQWAIKTTVPQQKSDAPDVCGG